MRHAHSLKGAARAVDQSLIEESCHRLEDILSAVRKSPALLDPHSSRRCSESLMVWRKRRSCCGNRSRWRARSCSVSRLRCRCLSTPPSDPSMSSWPPRQRRRRHRLVRLPQHLAQRNQKAQHLPFLPHLPLLLGVRLSSLPALRLLLLARRNRRPKATLRRRQ